MGDSTDSLGRERRSGWYPVVLTDVAFFVFLSVCVVTCGWSPHCNARAQQAGEGGGS